MLIVDTAGRLHIDAELMDEVRRIREAVEPDYTFLVVDAMTGQDAVNVAEASTRRSASTASSSPSSTATPAAAPPCR